MKCVIDIFPVTFNVDILKLHTYLGLFSTRLSGDGGVTIKYGSFWMITSGCRCIVCLFCRRSLHESDDARSFRFRRRPVVPRFCRVPIDGNRKLHAMPECANLRICKSDRLFYWIELAKLYIFSLNMCSEMNKKLQWQRKFKTRYIFHCNSTNNSHSHSC